MPSSVWLHREAGKRIWLGAGAAVSLMMVSGCSADKVLDAVNPVTWYRDATGASKNDTPADAANSANLEEGSKEPYPDLGSVPAEPTRGLTDEQKAQLAQGLIADRDHAHYTDEQIRGGDAGATMPQQATIPEEQLPSTNLGPSAIASVAPQRTAGSGNLAVGGALAPAAPRSAPAVPVAATREARVTTPAPRATPQGEEPKPTPPPAQMKPLPPPTPEAPFPGAPAVHPEPPPGPEQVAGVPVPPAAPVRAESAPKPPDIPPAAAVTATNPAAPAGGKKKSDQVAQIVFEPGSNVMPMSDDATLAKIPALHQQYGGVVRVVGYAAPPAAGQDPAGQRLAAYQAALDHANAVKQALVQDGIAAAEIVTEASPVRGSGTSPERADIYVEY